MLLVPGTKGLGWIQSHSWTPSTTLKFCLAQGSSEHHKAQIHPFLMVYTFTPLTSKASWSAPGSHGLAVSRVSKILKSNRKAHIFCYRLVYVTSGTYLHQNLKCTNYHPFPPYCCLECAASESQRHQSKEEQL